MSIVVDTSALAAVVFGESDAEWFAAELNREAGACSVSAASWVEAGMIVTARFGDQGVSGLRELSDAVGLVVVPVDVSQADLAIAAWQRFGKGRHPASLNLGDCFSYALAKQLGEPLLFKGRDFLQTDITSAGR